MSNPNNCAACDHKRNPQGGWCYMFRDEPQEVCMKHSARMSQRAPWPLMRLCGLSPDSAALAAAARHEPPNGPGESIRRR